MSISIAMEHFPQLCWIKNEPFSDRGVLCSVFRINPALSWINWSTDSLGRPPERRGQCI